MKQKIDTIPDFSYDEKSTTKVKKMIKNNMFYVLFCGFLLSSYEEIHSALLRNKKNEKIMNFLYPEDNREINFFLNKLSSVDRRFEEIFKPKKYFKKIEEEEEKVHVDNIFHTDKKNISQRTLLEEESKNLETVDKIDFDLSPFTKRPLKIFPKKSSRKQHTIFEESDFFDIIRKYKKCTDEKGHIKDLKKLKEYLEKYFKFQTDQKEFDLKNEQEVRDFLEKNVFVLFFQKEKNSFSKVRQAREAHSVTMHVTSDIDIFQHKLEESHNHYLKFSSNYRKEKIRELFLSSFLEETKKKATYQEYYVQNNKKEIIIEYYKNFYNFLIEDFFLLDSQQSTYIKSQFDLESVKTRLEDYEDIQSKKLAVNFAKNALQELEEDSYLEPMNTKNMENILKKISNKNILKFKDPNFFGYNYKKSIFCGSCYKQKNERKKLLLFFRQSSIYIEILYKSQLKFIIKTFKEALKELEIFLHKIDNDAQSEHNENHEHELKEEPQLHPKEWGREEIEFLPKKDNKSGQKKENDSQQKRENKSQPREERKEEAQQQKGVGTIFSGFLDSFL